MRSRERNATFAPPVTSDYHKAKVLFVSIAFSPPDSQLKLKASYCNGKSTAILVDHFNALIKLALSEDADDRGDVTCLAIVPIDMKVEAHFFAKEDDIIVGISLAEMIFNEVDPSLEVEWFKKDGDSVSKGTQFGKVFEVISKQCEDPVSILPELHWGEIASRGTHKFTYVGLLLLIGGDVYEYEKECGGLGQENIANQLLAWMAYTSNNPSDTDGDVEHAIDASALALAS
ncbi:hypothetical protein IFM89_038538 [Coptis chinensis]|uniref:Quinolinate phosphoribosyl transferase N-terminal domain-containing protein n=1 Tax=Coptis chinensis TaxID=261450 RepID=A0A835LKN0_9MAGN|nr:hypothetical protein IFM89_038538 [Coptis chinensis]